MKYNIVFATDQNYIQHLAVSLFSLLENNKDLEFNVYVINGGINEKKYKSLEEITSKYNCTLTNVEIDDYLFERLVKNHHFTKANYYRLLIQELIDVDKILYLDADIVVNGPIQELYNTNIDDVYIGAVENPGFDRHFELKMKKESNYFNSGVMLINVNFWKNNDLQNKVISFVAENPKVIRFVDQCGLNAIINGNWKKLPLRFNQQAVVFEEEFDSKYHCFSDDELKEAKESPVIIHYTGSSKPWHFRNNHPYKPLYWKYLRQTPFKRYFPEDLTILNVIKYLIPNKVKGIIRSSTIK